MKNNENDKRDEGTEKSARPLLSAESCCCAAICKNEAKRKRNRNGSQNESPYLNEKGIRGLR